MLIEALMTVCLVGPTPEPGPDAPYNDIKLVVQVPQPPNYAEAFGKLYYMHHVAGEFMNAANQEVPMSGSVIATTVDGIPTWRVSVTGTFVNHNSVVPDVAPTPYFLMTAIGEIPLTNLDSYGIRDDPFTQLGTVWGHNFLTPQEIKDQYGGTDDHVNGAPLWRVPCND